MNFLAHALLAGETPALIVGGVVGDWVKGVLPGALPADLAQGVALHRAIDVFAETHPAFCASRARMSQRVRRPNPLAGGELELRAEITAFEADFRAWLADARVFVALWRQHNLGQHGGPSTSG